MFLLLTTHNNYNSNTNGWAGAPHGTTRALVFLAFKNDDAKQQPEEKKTEFTKKLGYTVYCIKFVLNSSKFPYSIEHFIISVAANLAIKLQPPDMLPTDKKLTCSCL
jgi:hypothetical protein